VVVVHAEHPQAAICEAERQGEADATETDD
jgi:hypothetical protein